METSILKILAALHKDFFLIHKIFLFVLTQREPLDVWQEDMPVVLWSHKQQADDTALSDDRAVDRRRQQVDAAEKV